MRVYLSEITNADLCCAYTNRFSLTACNRSRTDSRGINPAVIIVIIIGAQCKTI